MVGTTFNFLFIVNLVCRISHIKSSILEFLHQIAIPALKYHLLSTEERIIQTTSDNTSDSTRLSQIVTIETLNNPFKI